MRFKSNCLNYSQLLILSNRRYGMIRLQPTKPNEEDQLLLLALGFSIDRSIDLLLYSTSALCHMSYFLFRLFVIYCTRVIENKIFNYYARY